MVLFLFAILFGCTRNESLSKGEYLAFLTSGAGQFFKERQINHLSYKLKMQLPEYTLLKRNDSINTVEKFNQELARDKDKLNFVLLLGDEKQSKRVKEIIYKPELFGRLIDYASIELASDFKLVQGRDTLPCAFVYLEPANSLQPVIRLSLAFENVKRSSDCTLIFNDNLFNNGQLKFHYGIETFNDLPKLKL